MSRRSRDRHVDERANDRLSDIDWRRALQDPEVVVCPRCRLYYSVIKAAGDRCDDMSGHGGTVERPCPGVLVLA